MKIQKFDFEENETIQIYVNKDEYKKSKTMKQINNLKDKYSNIAIFISGENDTVEKIKEILSYEKNKEGK